MTPERLKEITNILDDEPEGKWKRGDLYFAAEDLYVALLKQRDATRHIEQKLNRLSIKFSEITRALNNTEWE